MDASLVKRLDKAYEAKPLNELLAAPVDALQGLSAADADALQKALGIKTIKDLGTNKFFRWAQAIVALGE
jgi:hypothetical protein